MIDLLDKFHGMLGVSFRGLVLQSVVVINVYYTSKKWVGVVNTLHE